MEVEIGTCVISCGIAIMPTTPATVSLLLWFRCLRSTLLHLRANRIHVGAVPESRYVELMTAMGIHIGVAEANVYYKGWWLVPQELPEETVFVIQYPNF